MISLHGYSKRRAMIACLGCAAFACGPLHAAGVTPPTAQPQLNSHSPEAQRARRITASPQFKAAVAAFGHDHDQFVQDLITLTEIPAPPFGERERGQYFLKRLSEFGLENVEMDPEGNTMGVLRGRKHGRLLAIAAHLDTVFPAGTDVKVKREGTTLRAPGVSDDTHALALILAMLRSMRTAHLEPENDILFIGDVGEEGPGDLRGMRYLFGKGAYKDRIGKFISIDGPMPENSITNVGLGSRRFKVTFTGPGGHSWVDFGEVNPAFALGGALERLGRLEVPTDPKVSYSVGVVSGGTSVNSIPFETSMQVDMRSSSPPELDKVEAALRQSVADAVAEENATRSTAKGKIVADIQLIGNRPAGAVSPDSPVLRQVTATLASFGKTTVFETESTDSNIPISLGIPAFTMTGGSAKTGGRAHSLDEWAVVDPDEDARNFAISLAIALSVDAQE